MHEALFYSIDDESKKTVTCSLCFHRCQIAEGRRGICKVRENHDGILYTLVYGKLVSTNVDPIEKKPLFHVLPGSRSMSIATVGCNFRCLHCQNYQIAQYPALHEGEIPGSEVTPRQVVDTARKYNCASISYTYIEPTVFYEFAYDTAKLAHEQGIKNVFVSNGYTSPEATRGIAPYLDANNIDLKAFSDRFYREVCGAKLAPVLETIELMKSLGVWVEVTTLIIPGWNDSDDELAQIAGFIKGVDVNIPWHVSRFHPTYKMTDREATPVATLSRAREIGLAAGLNYVYVGNIHGEKGEDTICSNCGETIISRTGYTIVNQSHEKGKCLSCGTIAAGIF